MADGFLLYNLRINTLGYYFQLKRDYDKAIYYYNKSYRLDPLLTAPLSNLGNIFSEREEFEKALDYYKKGLTIDPNDISLLNNIGSLYIQKGNIPKAIKALETAIEIDPTFENPYSNLGIIYAHSDDERAIEYYAKALEINQDLFKTWFNLGNLFRQKDNYEEAIDSYKRCLEINPTYGQAWCNIGATYLNSGNLPEAEFCFKQSIQYNEDRAIDYYNLGNFYRITGSLNKSIIYYQKAIDINIDFASAWYNAGLSYLIIKDLDMAFLCLEEAVILDPKNQGAWGNLGRVNNIQNNTENAIDCFTHILEINPNDVFTLAHLGFSYIKLRKFDKAINYLKKALEIDQEIKLVSDYSGNAFYSPDMQLIEQDNKFKETINYKGEIWINLAIVYNELGNTTEALNCINQAESLNIDDYIVSGNKGIIYLNTLQYSEALEQFNRALQIIKDKGLTIDIKTIENNIKLAENAINLKPKLEQIDDEIDDLINISTLKDIRVSLISINKLFNEFFQNFNLYELPYLSADLLRAKCLIFVVFKDILEFKDINQDSFGFIKEVFLFKTEFIDFFQTVQMMRDITFNISGFSELNDISIGATEEIITKIRSFSCLGHKLSEVIRGNIKKKINPNDILTRDYFFSDNFVASVKDDLLIYNKEHPEFQIKFKSILNATKKNVVLILGQDTTEMERLKKIKICLEQKGYEGLIIKEMKTDNVYQSPEEKVNTIAHLCRFVIAEDTTLSGHIAELKSCENLKLVIAIIHEGDFGSTAMQATYPYDHPFINRFKYPNINEIENIIEKVIKWANGILDERVKYYDKSFGWRSQTIDRNSSEN